MDLQKKADILRALCLISTSEAGSGHPTSCLSVADIITVLFEKYFSYDVKNPNNLNNDRLIFSKGHSAPLLYSVFALSGALKTEELLTLRKFGSRLEGHPTSKFEYAGVATGSLGQGLSIGAGIALNAKKEGRFNKTFVLLGDGECAEGQIYEACNFASLQKLNNLIAIVDINGLGQTGKTGFYYDLQKYENIFYSLGFITKVIDGHNFLKIEEAFEEAVRNNASSPFVILARTVKGKGISFLEGREDFHGKALKKEELEKALLELSVSPEIIKENPVLFNLSAKRDDSANKQNILNSQKNPNYELGVEIATREAFGDALVEIGKTDPSIYVIDGDTANSTFTIKFKQEFPDRFIEGFIAEQNMISVAEGLSICGKIPFTSTFAAFLTRAFDQVRMAHIGNVNIKIIGTHAGVSIGEDGPSQMGLEDIAMFSTFSDSIVLQPCDAVSGWKLTYELMKHKGISYLRALRPKTKVIYKNEEDFKIGGAKVLRKSEKDVVTIVASGITVFEALRAYDILLEKGISVCVIDAYSIKPLDKKTIISCSKACKENVMITVEDHSVRGGLGDIVASELSEEEIKVIRLGVFGVPSSGDKESLFHKFGIDAESIVSVISGLTNEE